MISSVSIPGLQMPESPNGRKSEALGWKNSLCPASIQNLLYHFPIKHQLLLKYSQEQRAPHSPAVPTAQLTEQPPCRFLYVLICIGACMRMYVHTHCVHTCGGHRSESYSEAVSSHVMDTVRYHVTYSGHFYGHVYLKDDLF